MEIANSIVPVLILLATGMLAPAQPEWPRFHGSGNRLTGRATWI